ncbi:hypothetical protein niasHT_016492 [Heterodera trifolii]|uniref:Uncharacterized protein n=1 Tax=Heterodera trifolii TaxID=157864 RepID=A0ABD2KYI8_9BILA
MKFFAFIPSFKHVILLNFYLVIFVNANGSKENQCAQIETLENFKTKFVLKLYDEICEAEEMDDKGKEICEFLSKIVAYSQQILNMHQKNDEKQIINGQMSKLTQLIEQHFANTKQKIGNALAPEKRASIEQFVGQLGNDGEKMEQQQNDAVVKILDKQLKKNLKKIKKFNKKLLKNNGKGPTEKEMPEYYELSYQCLLIYEKMAVHLFPLQTLDSATEDSPQVGAVSAAQPSAVADGNNRRRRRKRGVHCCSNCCNCCGLEFGAMFRAFFKFMGEMLSVPWKVIVRAIKTIGYLLVQGVCSLWWPIAGLCILVNHPDTHRAQLYFCCKETPADAWAIYGKNNFPPDYGADQKGCSCWPKMGRDLANIWKVPPRSDQPATVTLGQVPAHQHQMNYGNANPAQFNFYPTAPPAQRGAP